MAIKKKSEGSSDARELWKQELVTPVTMKKYAKDTADVEKIILFGESNAGKTRWYLNVLQELKNKNLKKEEILMCIVYPDRPTGLTKLVNLVPAEFVDRVMIFPVNNYEEMVSATALAEQKLIEHHSSTGKHGWLVIELLEESWRAAQDYYSRQAYGVTLAEYFAQKRQQIAVQKDDASAYRAFEGWSDWPIIKFFHNFNWIDKIKRFPFNVIFTSEIKQEQNADSIFSAIGYRPAGEKDNLHRVDTILYLSHKGDKFTQQCFKLTGYSRLYSPYDVTDKNGYSEHQKILKKFEKAGYKSSAIQELEEEAGIKPPTPPTPPKPAENKKEQEASKEEPSEPKKEVHQEEQQTPAPVEQPKEEQKEASPPADDDWDIEF